MEMDQAVRNINLFAGMIHSSAGLSAWCFSMKSKKLFYSTCPNEETFLNFFQMNGCMDYAFSEEIDFRRPVFLSDPIGLIWAADYIYYSEEMTQPALVIVIGPVFSSEVSVRGLQEKIRDKDFSLSVQKSVISQLRSVPALPLASIFRYVTMMHYAVTEEEVSSFDFQYQHAREQENGTDGFGDEDVIFEDRESVESSYTLEQTILQLIRDGNVGYRQILKEKAAGGGAGQKKASLREEKNSMIILTGLAMRSAIEGGIPQRTARELEEEYTGKIEKASTIAEVMRVREALIGDLTGRVHQCQSRQDVSAPVQACCDFVERNLTKRLELSDIAKAVGYTEYYLTKKFRREMGIRLTDYIKEKRIELAKIWLVTTSRSIEEISDQLQFSTRGYFSRVFREKAGISPGAYRGRALRIAKEDWEKHETEGKL